MTPVLERSLYCELPAEKRQPLSFFNVPLEGMSTDDGGWVRPGTVPSPMIINLRNVYLDEPRACNVILEYRPYFEVDANSVVAAAYIDGVLYDLRSVRNILAHFSEHAQAFLMRPPGRASRGRRQ